MVNTLISEITSGDTVSKSSGPEIKEPALGDGTSKAGNIVGLDASDKATNVNANTVDLFMGILEKRYDTDIDTAIVDSKNCSIIVPISGRKYAVFIADQGGSLSKGWALTFGTAGNLTTVGADGLADTLPIVAYLDEDIVDDDIVAIVRWA